MKNLINLYLAWLQNTASLKLLLSIVLIMLCGIFYDKTSDNTFLWFIILPCLYLVPFILTTFIYVWIVKPIIWLINKIKGV